MNLLVYPNGRLHLLLNFTSSLKSTFKFTSLSHLSSQTLLSHPQPNIFSWNSLLRSSIETNKSESSLFLFRQILKSNVKPNDLTFSLLLTNASSLNSSTSLKSIEEAQQIHSHILKSGFDRFVYVGTALLDLYSKSGYVFLAYQLFEDMPHRDLISWNALISGYSFNGYDLDALNLFSQMLKEGLEPCRVTLVSVIPSCARSGLLFQGKTVHGFGIKVSLDLDSRVQNALTHMYSKCSDLDSTRFLFEEMSEKSIISWNTMISAYGQNGYFDEAMIVFKQMLEENVRANSVTIMSLLSAINTPLDSIHSYCVKTSLDMDSSVVTSLVCMYSKFGKVELAKLLHESMPQKNLVSLTAIISSYAEKEDMASAVQCFNQIQVVDMKPDEVSMVSVLHGFKHPTYVEVGSGFHGYSIKSGLASHTLVINGLSTMYAKFDEIEAAFSLFQSLDDKPLISWNSMISSYIQAGKWNEAMNLFCEMKMYGHNPDPITIVNLLSGCSNIGSLQNGRRIHNYILRQTLEVDEDFVSTALIDMYTKCGSIKYAERVFQSIRKPCLAAWNSVILGCGMYGLELEALGYYSEMVKQDLVPDEITFLGVLSACSHAGLISEGRKYFKIMTEEFGLTPRVQHCASMVDLLSRSGSLDEAVSFIKTMEIKPDSVVWLALLSACCINQEIKLGECVAKQILLLDRRYDGGFYVLMSNLYASIGRWNDVARVRKMMRDTGGDGYSGTSLIESNFSELFQETHSNFR